MKNNPPYSAFTNRKFWHFSYALKALEGVKGRALDVGCGSGRMTREIAEFRPDLKIMGCDKKPRRGGEKFDSGVEIVDGDVHKLTFVKESFSAVLMIDVLEHLETPRVAIREVKRILKKKGIFHLAVPCEKSLATWDGWLDRFFKINLKRRPVGHVQLFTPEEVKRMLKEEGFEVIDFHFSQHFWDQFFSLVYYLYVGAFRRGRYLKIHRKEKKFLPLTFLIKLGVWLSNFESMFLKGLKGRTLHITSTKSVIK